MTDRSTPEHYRPMQIVLHWVVALAVVIQIALHEPIVRVIEARQSGLIPDAGDMPYAWVHVGVGFSVLLAVLGRLYLRYRYGVPGHAPDMPPLQARMADFMHRALYALLLGMVVTGMLTWNGIAPLGTVHFLIGVTLFLMVVGHAAAAIYNHFGPSNLKSISRIWF